MMSSVDGELAEATLERQKLNADKAKNASGDLKVCNGTACFIAGTKLHTSNGLKAIETLVNGELVWARDENTLEYGFRPIVATKATPNQTLYEVIVGNADGEQEKLYTTAEHPFWVDGEGWRKASLLEAGMKLLGPQNETLEVVSQTATGGTDTVFNIQVHEFSTYHVGTLGVWVHNSECCVVKSDAGKVAQGSEVENKGLSVQERMNPRDIRFTQDTVSPNFSDGGTLSDAVNQLRGGAITVDSFPTIRVVEYDGKIYSLDNRRLTIFSAADQDSIPIERLSLSDPAVKAEFLKKFRPINDGQNIVVVPSKDRGAARSILREAGKYGQN